MADYPYTKTVGKLSEFLEKIRQIGIPDKVTNSWLSSIGFSSSNDRRLIGVIKFIGFIDNNGKPTNYWNEYRGKDYKKVLAKAIQNGYSELYSIYPDAHYKSTTELENYFSTKSSAGKQVIQSMVATFKKLCEFANFDEEFEEIEEEIESNHNEVEDKVESNNISLPHTPNVHIDLQIHIAPEATSDQIDKIFESMGRHIFGK